EGRLVLDFKYGAQVVLLNANGYLKESHGVTLQAIAVLDPEAESWQVLQCPETSWEQQNNFYHHTTLWHGEVFTSVGGKVCQYSATKKAWQILDVPDVGN